MRLALLAGDLRQLPLSEPMVALLLGVAFGKELPGLLDIEEQVRDVVLLEGARLLLAWSVMAAALVPRDCLRPARRDLPTRLRQLLSTESGANDGLVLPLVGLALAAALPANGSADVL